MNGRELFEHYALERAFGTQRNQYWEFLGSEERDFWNRFAERLARPELHVLFDPYEVDYRRYAPRPEELLDTPVKPDQTEELYPNKPSFPRLRRFLGLNV